MGWAMLEHEDTTMIPRNPKDMGQELSIRTPGLAMKMLSKNKRHLILLYQSKSERRRRVIRTKGYGRKGVKVLS